MKIYVASSWRNEYQQLTVAILRSMGHEVYDFRNPTEGNTGFALIGSYEGSGSAWSLPVPEGLELILHVGTAICLVSGILLSNLEKPQN